MEPIPGSKNTYVGQFFEELTHRIIGGELLRDEHGDLTLWNESLVVEVKSSGYQSSYGFRLSTEQIEGYERMAAFPFDRAWYFLFSYDNPGEKGEDGKRRSALKPHIEAPDVHQYLAASVKWGLAVDISLIKAWKDVHPHSTKSVMGHLGVETVNLKCRDVYPLTNGGFKEGLRSLGLIPDEFTRLSGRVDTTVQFDLFETYPVSVPLTVIVPKHERQFARKLLGKYAETKFK